MARDYVEATKCFFAHKYKEAEVLEREELKIQGETFGSNHPLAAQTMYRIARLANEDHRPADAEYALLAALSDYEWG